LRTKRQKTVKRRDFGGVKLEYYHLPAGGTVSLHNGPLMVASRLSTPLGKSDRPIQDELLTVNCESEAERFRGENRLCKKIPLSPFTAQLVQLSTSKACCKVRCNTSLTTTADCVVVLSCYRPISTDFPTFG
jgi:hypothetical protein